MDDKNNQAPLREGIRKNLVKNYSYRRDQRHSDVGQTHVHVFQGQQQIFALNQDGTAHDQSHGVEIPKKVADALAAKEPSIIIPKGRLIEGFEPE